MPFHMAHNVAQNLAEQARSHPEHPAVRAPVGRSREGAILYDEKTFSELEGDASAAAFYLQSLGMGRGTRVLLMVRPGLDLIRIVFALFKLGAVPVVIDPGMGLKSFLRCVRHSKPEVIVGIPLAIWIGRLFRPSFRTVRAKVVVNSRFEAKCRSFAQAGSFPVVDSAADELAAILFTSGSTGPAKGVLYTHGIFSAQVASIRSQYGIKPGEVDLPMLPVFALFNPALGMCTVVPEMNPSRPASVDPAKIVQAIEENGVTNTFGSPALWTKIARYCIEHSIVLPTVRRILMAGAPVSPELMRQMQAVIPNGEIHTPYGATEALPVSSISATEVLEETALRTELGEGTCVGAALPGVRVRIIEAVDEAIGSIGDSTELPTGQIGEIIVSGPAVTHGYDALPQADALSKIKDSGGHWHRMGDMGWQDAQGRLWFCGRKAERVLSATGPMYTDCCEAIFNRHPAVARSALIDQGQGIPAIVIEPEGEAYPQNADSERALAKSILELGQLHALTQSIQTVYFEKDFPVDVRHNAKIHRLALAKKHREN